MISILRCASVFALLFGLSGCVQLSREYVLVVQSGAASYENSSCGYAAYDWMNVGKGNLSVFSEPGMRVEFCSKVFLGKAVAQGFIVPIIPAGGREYKDVRWVQIRNKNKDKKIKISDHLVGNADDLERMFVCTGKRYPTLKCPRASSLINSPIDIEFEETVWISVPVSDKYDVYLEFDNQIKRFTFVSSTRYSWWMVTV